MILLAFIWGSSFILMKKGLIVFNDLEVAQLRMGVAWLSLLPFVWSKLFSIDKKHIIPILIVGLFGNGFPAFLFTKAQTQLDSSLIGILNALVPLFTFVLAMLLFKTKVKVSQLIGILLGLSGAVWLIAGGGLMLENGNYSWYVIIATLCYAISLNTIKNLGYFCLILVFLISLLVNKTQIDFDLLIVLITLGILTKKATKKQKYYYSSFIVESLPIFWFFLVLYL